MPKNSKKNVTTKRRPAKKRSPSSPVFGLSYKAIKNVTKKIDVKRLVNIRKIYKKNTAKVRKTNRDKQVFSFPVSRKSRLVLTINRTKASANNEKIKAPPIKKLSITEKIKHSKKWQLLFPSMLLLIGLCGAIFFGMQTIASPIEHSPKHIKTHKAVVAPKTEKFLPRSAPVTLRIPAIELNTNLITVGMKADGEIEVPTDYTKAGWYRSSPTPGEKGPSVIVGHLDNINGMAVFWRLQELTPGHVIEIDREDGKTAKFIIEMLKQVPQDENFPTEEVYGNTDRASLRLITCGGTFNHLTQRYSDNTVVFASLVPDDKNSS